MICCAGSSRIVSLRVRCEMNELADQLANRGIDQAIKRFNDGLKWIKRSLFVLTHGERKVRTPQDRVAVNDGPE